MHIYFSGIGGVGIGPLALLALDAGYTISGSDLQQSEMISYLRDRGARVYIGQDGTQIADEHLEQPIDWFVHSAALPQHHPEIAFAKERGIKMSKRDEFLNQIIREKNMRLIAVSGTHGKTTTTGMLIWVFKQLGIPISYSIGTSLSFGPPAQYQKDSEYFIYECDEFDRNFLQFKPSFSLIPSLDYDHPDTYPTQEDYNYAFSDFIASSSVSFMWQQSADQLKLSSQTNVIVLSPSDPRKSAITLPGELMRQNGWLVLESVKHILKIDTPQLLPYINSFPGTNRRFEKLAENLYSDYAHHPVEIAATIQMAQEINKNIVILYQPHQNIRQHEIMNEGGYKNAFEGAKKVYWLPTYQSREDQNLKLIPSEELIESTTNKAGVQPANMDDQLSEATAQHRANGDLVLGMSAGDLDHWLRDLVHDS